MKLALLLAALGSASAFSAGCAHVSALGARRLAVRMEAETEAKNSPEEVTKKFGLEAGLFSALTDKDRDKKQAMATAKDLLAQYGAAYLLTSIPLALISFTLCYLLVDNGVDVASLLSKVGIEVSGMSEKAGTVAIAYAAHKAASPIRFPPTVALTPVVARLIGKSKKTDGEA
ncbi:hypothetical protein T492DRAFT_1095352 [Pavlovales sp. CCMP2436]|nr:hypothetical protein T492DRAFT_1095352 [Pavlovales sp. CCMP2436]